MSDAIEVMVQQEFERRLAQKVWQRIFLFEDDKKELEEALRSLAAKVREQTLEDAAKRFDGRGLKHYSALVAGELRELKGE